MKKILCFFFVISVVFAAQSQDIPFAKTRTMQLAGTQLYIVSLKDLGFPQNILAVNYEHIVTQAAEKGYTLCPESLIQTLYDTYSDGMSGKKWSAFSWLTICTPSGTTYRIGKGSDGKFLQSSPKETHHVFLHYTHACLVFTK